MKQAIVLNNDNVVQIGWAYDKPIPGCLGFAIYRTNTVTNERVALPAWVGFKEETQPWQVRTTAEWPVQKFNWRDTTVKLHEQYQYEIVPVTGTPGHLEEMKEETLYTAPILVNPRCGPYTAAFNRGILANQAIGPRGEPDFGSLLDQVEDVNSPLRAKLAGNVPKLLTALLNRARRENGQCYIALYELNDPQMIELLKQCPFAHVILANAGPNDQVNAVARRELKTAGIDVIDRMLPDGHLGHNKFMVYVDSKGKPQSVLTGSTNWSTTGLCTQSNNAIIIDSPDLANAFMDYWSRLKDDKEQSFFFRRTNSYARPAPDIASEVWFAPNTGAQNKPSDASMPADIFDVSRLIREAKQAIFFLAFQPGDPNVLEEAAKAQGENPGLFVRGAVTNQDTANGYIDAVHLYHGKVTPNAIVVANPEDQVDRWQKELTKANPQGYSIIHDKIIVIDPLSDNCTVITGSHNLGYRASYNNDENLLIIRGNKALAAAFTVHVMDVYDHYRWRNEMGKTGQDVWHALERNDSWQSKYFENGIINDPELKFWFGEAPQISQPLSEIS